MGLTLSHLMTPSPAELRPLVKLLGCLFDLEEEAARAYLTLLEGPLTVKALARKLSKSRPTVQKLVAELYRKGLVRRVRVNLTKGGYVYLYAPIQPSAHSSLCYRLLKLLCKCACSSEGTTPSPLYECLGSILRGSEGWRRRR